VAFGRTGEGNGLRRRGEASLPPFAPHTRRLGLLGSPRAAGRDFSDAAAATRSR
jgi:hypothetical protein